MGVATTAAPYGFWATNHWVYLLGQPLSRNRVFQNFSGEPPLKQSNPVSIEYFANFSVCIVKRKEIFSKALSILFRTISKC